MEEKFIKIDNIIKRARSLGVDFGKGNPSNRLRYYAKLGLLPPAVRKCLGSNIPTGAYPESVIDILVDIDSELKQGKTLRRIIQEKKEIGELRNHSLSSGLPSIVVKQNKVFSTNNNYQDNGNDNKKDNEEKYDYNSTFDNYDNKRENEFFSLKGKKSFLSPTSTSSTPRRSLQRSVFIKVFIFLIIGGGVASFFSGIKNTLSDSFFASLLGNLVQLDNPVDNYSEPQSDNNISEGESLFPQPEPYLTINTETDINAPLNLKNGQEPAQISLFQDELSGTITLGSLTKNQTYTLPSQTGTICLSSGNCVGLFGEVSSPGGTSNRLVKFIGSRRIGDSSINDNYDGISVYITPTGNVGIGTENPSDKLEVAGDILTTNLFAKEKIGIGIESPSYALEVEGRIQASGDVCTSTGGGKCLSELSRSSSQSGQMFFGIASGIQGTGSSDYIPMWVNSSKLGDSVIFQGDTSIGIGTTDPNETLTISGAISLSEMDEPDLTDSFGKIYVENDGKLYYKDGTGTVYDLTSSGISGSGSEGFVTFFSATSTLSGDSDFFWNSTSSRLGILTNSPEYPLEVRGTIRSGGSGTSGQLRIYSEQGDTDYELVFQPNPTSTDDSIYTWPADMGTNNYVLTTDGSGGLAWQSVSGIGTLSGSGTTGRISKWTGTSALSDSSISDSYASGVALTIDAGGDVLITNNLTVNGALSGVTGTLSTSITSPLYTGIGEVIISSASSSDIILDPASGVIQLGVGDVIKTSGGHSIRTSGEQILREVIPIFGFDLPIRTATTSYVTISRVIEDYPFSSAMVGTTRIHKLIIRYADTLDPSDANSDYRVSNWQVWNVTSNSQTSIFNVPATPSTNDIGLGKGNAYVTSVTLPGTSTDDWRLDVKLPTTGKKIQIYQIFLAAYDQVD